MMVKGVRKIKPKIRIIREIKEAEISKNEIDILKRAVSENESSNEGNSRETNSSLNESVTRVVAPSSPSESVQREDAPRPAKEDSPYDPWKGKDTFVDNNERSYNPIVDFQAEVFSKSRVGAVAMDRSLPLQGDRMMQKIERKLRATSESAKNYETSASGGSRKKEQKRYPWDV